MSSRQRSRVLPLLAFVSAFAALGVVGRTPSTGWEGTGKQEGEQAGGLSDGQDLRGPGAITKAQAESEAEAGGGEDPANLIQPTPAAPAPLPELTLPIDWESTRVRPAPTVEEVFEEEELDYSSVRIALGEMLFHDPRLSVQGNLACASCHVHSVLGTRWAEFPEHTETENLFTEFDPHLFWDPDLTELDPDAPEVEARIEGILSRVAEDELYHAVIAASEESLPTDLDETSELLLAFSLSEVPAPTGFDLYLRGDADKLSREARQGFAVFCEVGCTECHFGWGLGGRAFQKLGREHDYFADRGKVTGEDLGKFNETGDAGDRYLFRVPRLRGMSQTGPYYHDGTQQTLSDAIQNMAYYQLDVELEDREVQAIAAFLASVQGPATGPSAQPKQKEAR